MSKLFVMRHAIAQDRIEFAKTGLPDESRPLTRQGKQKLSQIVKKLKDLDLPVDVLLQSELTRSQQSTHIVQKIFPDAQIKTLRHLSPEGSIDKLYKELQTFAPKNIFLIGHEDQLSSLVSYLLTKNKKSFLHFKKAGIASLEYSDHLLAGNLTLNWMMTPQLLLK